MLICHAEEAGIRATTSNQQKYMSARYQLFRERLRRDGSEPGSYISLRENLCRFLLCYIYGRPIVTDSDR